MWDYSEKVMDHYRNPRNVCKIDNADLIGEAGSLACGDSLKLYIKLENGVIKDIRFNGVACTISTASTSVMTELLKGKTVEEAKKIIENYFAMVDGKEYDPELLDEAVIMKGVYKQPNRIKCATTGWHAMEQMIEESEEK